MRRVLCFSLLLAACGAEELEAVRSPLGGPLVDGADRACRVVLRDVGRSMGPTGPEVDCVAGRCFYVWSGHFDVRDEPAVTGAGLRYFSSGTGQWYDIAAAEEGPAPNGYRRFAFSIRENTVSPGMSFTSLSRTRIEVIPFVERSDGLRLFDHNVFAASHANYVLLEPTQWAYTADPAVCAAPPSAFAITWAGEFGHGFWRGCENRPGLSEPMVIDSYVRERACKFIEAEVLVPSDAPVPAPLLAEVEISRDGGPIVREPLLFQRRNGSNDRYRWEILSGSGGDLMYVPWTELKYAFRFSSDGVNWFRIAQDEGPDGGAPRTILRTFN